MTILEMLEAEHATFTTLFDQVEKLLPELDSPKEIKLLGRLTEALLRGHAELETNLAYAALDHILEQRGQLDHLYQDHKEIDARLERVQSAKGAAEARRLLRAALQASRDHFEREERTVFRLIPQLLPGEALTELGAAWARQRRAPPRAESAITAP